MTWEAVSALSSLITGAVIVLTVIFAARQVRSWRKESFAD